MDFYVIEGYIAAEILFLTKFPHSYNYCQYCEYNLHKSHAKGMCEEEKLVTPEVSLIKGGLGQTKWSSAAMAESNILRPSLNSQPTFPLLSIWPRHNFLWTVAIKICDGADTKNTRPFIYVYLKINQFKQIWRSTDCLKLWPAFQMNA